MSGYLLDTNVISELTKSPPDTSVVAFLSERDDLWIPIIALYEIEYGLQLLPAGRRRDMLELTMNAFIREHDEHILPIDHSTAVRAANLRAHARRSGQRLRNIDALIAGTAKAHDLILATRNTADFDYLDLALLNPWQEP